jgi:hypothetical protein
MDARDLVVAIRELVEERLQVDLAPLAAIRLENRLFDALAQGQNNVFRIADRNASLRRGISPWK